MRESADKVKEWIDAHSPKDYCEFCVISYECSNGMLGFGFESTDLPCFESDVREMLDEDSILEEINRE